ncbi:hypothetical protein HY991_04325 [Candidatus Micrarchaeota archaeon]|nr:hypothetical protein [Candidatus Micrarchaeota archaeon]
MRRGQAFDTMMLVISVIVAVAILGILLGFIGGINLFGSTADYIMPQLLKKVSQSGYGVESASSVEFKIDSKLYWKNIIGETSVDPANLFAACDSNICGSGKSLTLPTGNPSESSKITVNKGVKANIAICTADGVTYCMIIHASKKTASDKCDAFITASTHLQGQCTVS